MHFVKNTKQACLTSIINDVTLYIFASYKSGSMITVVKGYQTDLQIKAIYLLQNFINK